jgi:arabinofuranosyltransferase
VFVAIVGAHLLWRKAYYDAWLPNTFSAKTGDVGQQWAKGKSYLGGYLAEAGPALYMVCAGVAIAVVRRHREMLTLVSLAVGVVAYIMLIGGDWMPHFRFMAPFEPFAFVLVCVGVRAMFDGGDRSVQLAIVLFALWVGVGRYFAFEDARRHFRKEDTFWKSAVNQSADWLVEHGRPGWVAVADMGYVAYRTDYPILDLLGLVDPVISKLPGGYTKKTGRGYVDRVFDVMPAYFVLVGEKDCTRMHFPAQRKLHEHRSFARNYELAALIPHTRGGNWCIFERKGHR